MANLAHLAHPVQDPYPFRVTSYRRIRLLHSLGKLEQDSSVNTYCRTWGWCQNVWGPSSVLRVLTPGSLQYFGYLLNAMVTAHAHQAIAKNPLAVGRFGPLRFATPWLPPARGTLDVRRLTCVTLTRWLRPFQTTIITPSYGRNASNGGSVAFTKSPTVNENRTSKTIQKASDCQRCKSDRVAVHVRSKVLLVTRPTPKCHQARLLRNDSSSGCQQSGGQPPQLPPAPSSGRLTLDSSTCP